MDNIEHPSSEIWEQRRRWFEAVAEKHKEKVVTLSASRPVHLQRMFRLLLCWRMGWGDNLIDDSG
jgi:hypothetical protein